MITTPNRLICVVLLVSSICSAGDLPDPHITPGATNPEVAQENIPRKMSMYEVKTLNPSAGHTLSVQFE